MNIKSHKYIEYIVLVFSLLTYFSIFFIFRHNNQLRILITGVYAISYTIWGVVHHWLEKRLSVAVFLEYFLISLLVFVLVLSALSF